MDSPPSSDAYVELDVATLGPSQPALHILSIHKDKNGSVFLPSKHPLWLKPGHYMARLFCDRTYEDGGQQTINIGTAGGLGFDFDFVVTAGNFYTLDCSITPEHDQKFSLYATPLAVVGTK